MDLIKYLRQEKLYGIIREDNEKKALEVASAYIEGGIKFIELNCPLSVAKTISKTKDIVIAQGGIITNLQAQKALEAGADIISSPIFQQNLVRFAACRKVCLLPSVTTPNEAYNAWKNRIPLIKIYPVAEMGGDRYIKELIKPMPFLNLLPCGFVKLDKIRSYLEAGAVAVGVGREFYDKSDYREIVKTIKETIKQIKYI